VIVLANLSGAAPGDIAHGIAGLENPELAPEEHKEIAIDPKIFDAYVGEYDLEAGLVLSISHEADRFYVQTPIFHQNGDRKAKKIK
jgi:hypothetical protein